MVIYWGVRALVLAALIFAPSVSSARDSIFGDRFVVIDGNRVTVSTEGSGQMSPISSIVVAGNPHSIKVSADYGHRLESIAGCSGELVSEYYEIPSVLESCEVMAIFKPLVFDIQFDSQGGSELQVQQLEFGAELPSFEHPTRPDYVFLGWEPALPEFMPASNLFPIAQWGKAFFLDENNITVRCPYAAVGASGIVNGKLYTKRSREQINEDNAETSYTSGITSMEKMFQDSNFRSDISSWDTSSVTTMAYMFDGASRFNANIGSWDTSNVTDMRAMFLGARTFNAHLSDWNTGAVTDMSAMFASSSFNQDIGRWDTSKVKRMVVMFSRAEWFNQDISNWDVSTVESMNGMFQYTERFSQDISEWDVSAVSRFDRMFKGSKRFNQDLSAWCVASISEAPSEFAADASLNSSFYPKWGVPCDTE